jgi:hypothetical protein
MVRVLEAAGYDVHATDIEQGQDFLDGDLTPGDPSRGDHNQSTVGSADPSLWAMKADI